VGARHAVAVVGYGTKMGAEKDGVTYEALRVGGEVLGDTMLGRFGTWGELHVAGAISATYLSADGTYCVGGTGDGVDCDDAMQVPRVDGDLSGLYTAGTLTLALDIARSSRSAFHLARLGVMVSGGQMPRLVNGEQQRGTAFITGGLGLTLGFGAGR
jgi:hypothetical protein